MQHVRLMRLWAGHGALLLALTAVGVAVAATWTAQALLTSRIFAVLISEAPLSDPALRPLVLALVAVLLTRPLLVLARQLLAHRAMTRVKSALRSRALAAFIRRSALDPAVGRTGHDHAAVVDGIENLDAYLSGYIPQLGVTILVIGVVGSTMTVIDPVTGLVAVAATLLLPSLPRLWDRVLAARGADHWEAYQELHAEFVDSMQGMTTLVAFGADRRREEQLARASQRLLARTLGQLRISLLESGLSGFALSAVPAVVLATVVARSRDLGAFEVFVLVLLSVELVRPLRDLAALWHAGYLGTFSGPRVMDLLDDDAAGAHRRAGEAPGGTCDEAPDGVRGGTCDEAPDGVPGRTCDGAPDGVQGGTCDEAPDGVPGGARGSVSGGAVGASRGSAAQHSECSRPMAGHPDQSEPTAPRVAVRCLTARYPRTEAPALENIDLDFAPGLTAVVGATGSGKSTLAAVLVGLLSPESGTIEVDGAACGPDRLLDLVSLVPQDPVLLGATIEQDVALGLPGEPGSAALGGGATPGDGFDSDRLGDCVSPGSAAPGASAAPAIAADLSATAGPAGATGTTETAAPLGAGRPSTSRQIIARAARTAGIGTDDASLALGTPVGEAGALLSGGQRQRVALARALAQQRGILILDESTSALDPAAEARLVETVRSDTQRTVIAITHRLAVARGADRVVVLDHGRVVEQGAPDELLARDGALRALVSAELNGSQPAESTVPRAAAHHGPSPAEPHGSPTGTQPAEPHEAPSPVEPHGSRTSAEMHEAPSPAETHGSPTGTQPAEPHEAPSPAETHGSRTSAETHEAPTGPQPAETHEAPTGTQPAEKGAHR